MQSLATNLPNAADLLTRRRRQLVEKAPVIDALFDALVVALTDGVGPAVREQIRRIGRAEARPLSEYRVAQRAIVETLRAEHALDDHIEDAVIDVVHHAIASTSDRLPSVADAIPIHVVIVDREERIAFINASAASLWQRAPEDCIGLTIRDVVGGAAYGPIRRYSERALAGETLAYESPFVTIDGERHLFLNTYTPQYGPQREVIGFIATGTDISARKNVEDKLRAVIDELHDERELRDRVVSSLAHDLRTPLSSMRVGAEILLKNAHDAGRVQQVATRIARNVSRADHMIRDLLDANAIRGGGTIPIERETCNVVKIVQEAIDEMSAIHGNRFVMRASKVAIEGTWDASAVRRIIENLCANAAKYGRPDTTITVSLIGTERDVQLEVHNEGEPIEAIDRLFVAFRRAPNAVTQQGWGIGLALVRGLAEAHGGDVSVTSTREAGTTFRVVLPR